MSRGKFFCQEKGESRYEKTISNRTATGRAAVPPACHRTEHPDWYVFPAGQPQPTNPAKPCTSFKIVWTRIRKEAGITGRWHDNRHTFITDLAESGEASDTTIESLPGTSRNRCSSTILTSACRP